MGRPGGAAGGGEVRLQGFQATLLWCSCVFAKPANGGARDAAAGERRSSVAASHSQGTAIHASTGHSHPAIHRAQPSSHPARRGGAARRRAHRIGGAAQQAGQPLPPGGWQPHDSGVRCQQVHQVAAWHEVQKKVQVAVVLHAWKEARWQWASGQGATRRHAHAKSPALKLSSSPTPTPTPTPTHLEGRVLAYAEGAGQRAPHRLLAVHVVGARGDARLEHALQGKAASRPRLCRGRKGGRACVWNAGWSW